MTTLILIRHGQSTANIRSVFAGSLDMPLTELGLTQAKLTAAYVAAHYSVEAVYASDLSRAFDTGKALADLMNISIIPEKDLREIHAGAWEGHSFEDLKQNFPDSYGIWLSHIGSCVCPEGESVAQLQQRVLATLRRICEENPGRTVAVATHATPIRTLQCHCSGLGLGHMKDIPWVSNASITVAQYDGGEFTLKDISLDGHLGAMTSRFTGNV